MDWLPQTKSVSVTLAEFVLSARGETDLFVTSCSRGHILDYDVEYL
jgi:hypothetical protein